MKNALISCLHPSTRTRRKLFPTPLHSSKPSDLHWSSNTLLAGYFAFSSNSGIAAVRVGQSMSISVFYQFGYPRKLRLLTWACLKGKEWTLLYSAVLFIHTRGFTVHKTPVFRVTFSHGIQAKGIAQSFFSSVHRNRVPVTGAAVTYQYSINTDLFTAGAIPLAAFFPLTEK